METTKIKTLIDKKLFVVGYGTDCDGYNSGSVTRYFSEGMAEYFAWLANDWSDGIRYVCVNEAQAIEYCRDFQINPFKALSSVYSG